MLPILTAFTGTLAALTVFGTSIKLYSRWQANRRKPAVWDIRIPE